MTFDTSGKLHLYRNGVEVGGTGTTGTTTTGTTTLYFGGNQGSASCFNGTIDEIRYYSSALSADQMADIYGAYGPMVAYVNPGGGNAITGPSSNLGFMGTCVGHAGTAGITYSWSKVSGPAATFRIPTL